MTVTAASFNFNLLNVRHIELTFYKLKRDGECPPPVFFEAQLQMGSKNRQGKSINVGVFVEIDLFQGEP